MKRISIIVLLLLSSISILFGTRSINFKFGIFTPNLESDLWETNFENLSFSKSDFNNSSYALEIEYFANPFISLSVEGGTYSNTVYSEYSEYVYDDDSPIYQNMFLRISGLELNVKVYPIGYKRFLIPYIGGGAGIYSWKYEQWGDFINFEDGTIQDGYAYTKAYSPGFNLRIGIIIRIKRHLGISFEAKDQYLKGTLSSLFEGFEKLDLSGRTYNLGVHIYFR